MNINSDLKNKYERDGYAIVKNVVDKEIADEIKSHINWLVKKYPDTRPEAFHHDMLIRDPFIHHLLHQKKILDNVQKIIGPDIALFGAHYIAKKPFSGQPVGWHQDGSYWPLKPMNVVSVWLAGTHSDEHNACMRVIPGTQNKKLLKPSEMIKLDTKKYVLDLARSRTYFLVSSLIISDGLRSFLFCVPGITLIHALCSSECVPASQTETTFIGLSGQ